MNKISLLDISRIRNTYRFRLEQPDEPGAAVRQYSSPTISSADQQSMRQAMKQTALSPLGPSLEELGRLMFNLLLPKDIKEFLRDLKTSLIISTDDPEMPWELLFDDDSKQFLGLKYTVGRRLVTEASVEQRGEVPPLVEPSFLLIGNPREDLQGAEQEFEELDKLISRHGHPTRLLFGSRAELMPVQLALQEDENYAGIHFAGHADYDKSSRQDVLLLAKGEKLSTGTIRKLVRGHPFVFLNACGTDKSSELNRRAGTSWKVTEGLASAFIRGGARCVIGTRWEVDDLEAAEFTVLFYEGALQGIPIGEALRQAKLRFRTKWPDSATWAAFVLYGDPRLLLLKPIALYLPDGQLNRVRFAPKVADIFDLLAQEAQQLGHDFIGAPHLFITLTQIDGGVIQNLLQQLGYSTERIRNRLRDEIRRGSPSLEPPELARSSFSERIQHIISFADEQAKSESAAYIEERHLLLGFIRDTEGVTAESLQQQGVNQEHLYAILQGEDIGGVGDPLTVISTQKVPPAPFPASRVGVDFTDEARQVFVFALREAYQMGYSTIQTPHFFVGLAKVRNGCTARALQQQGFHPKNVYRTIRSVMPPVGSPLKGLAKISPESLSTRVQSIIDIAADEAGNSTIEDYHLLIGFLKIRGSSTAGFLVDLGIDLGEMLAFAQDVQKGIASPISTPLLNKLGRDLTREARDGKLKPLIGRKREISRIAQILARTDKNTPLLIGEAGVGKTTIVEGLAQRITEGRVPPHLRGKRIIELPIVNLVAGTKYRGDLEERVSIILQEANQPDIIIFLDEIHTLVGAGQASGGALDVGNILKPALARGEIRCIGATTLAEFRKSIEKDAALARRFRVIMIEEASPEETLEILFQTRNRYETHHGVRILDEALEAAVNLSNAYIIDRLLPDKACDLVEEACVRILVGTSSQWSQEEATNSSETLVIDAESIAQVVAAWTGIPVARLTEAEQTRLLKLEELLQERVVGQDDAVKAVAQAVRLGRAGLKKPNRPVGVFLFVGPTGVGKTQLAKTLAEVLFGSERDIIRLDMSEFMEAHNVARLIGAPPGYKGYEEEGQLTGALRTRPYSVVLLDEIEKAHPRVFDLFLQLFDEGRLTDAQGQFADGKNAIFIMTSNVGTELLNQTKIVGFAQTKRFQDDKSNLLAELHNTFRLEFLNRLDEVIYFHRLSPKHIRTIAHLQLDALSMQLKQQHGIDLILEDEALEQICTEGYSEMYGARPLERAIERLVTKPLSSLIIKGVRGIIRVKLVESNIFLDCNGK